MLKVGLNDSEKENSAWIFNIPLKMQLINAWEIWGFWWTEAVLDIKVTPYSRCVQDDVKAASVSECMSMSMTQRSSTTTQRLQVHCRFVALLATTVRPHAPNLGLCNHSWMWEGESVSLCVCVLAKLPHRDLTESLPGSGGGLSRQPNTGEGAAGAVSSDADRFHCVD